MKFKTVREGEQAVIYNEYGEGRIVVGPARVFLYRERFEKLSSFTAGPYEYLVVTDNSGTVEHKPGPCQMFLDPLLYKSIHKSEGIKFDANHILVVYKRLKDQSVQRKVIEGPAVFVPDADEWLHEFEWHGIDPQKPGHPVAGANRFTKLAVIPDQFDYNVTDVRTNDDITIVVKIMIFYELVDVVTMLDTTQDPIADMMNSVCADVIAFVGRLHFTEFLKQTKTLGTLEAYPLLTERAKRMGYRVNKVVFRGYQASIHLQEMQNKAIRSRTELKIESELETMAQKLIDFKLQREQNRKALRQSIEKSKLDHKMCMENLKEDFNKEMNEMKHKCALECSQLITETDLKCEEALKEKEINYLKQISDLGIDTTEYLLSRQPPTVSEEHRVVTSSS